MASRVAHFASDTSLMQVNHLIVQGMERPPTGKHLDSAQLTSNTGLL